MTASALKQIHGRGMNNLSEQYKLPGDAPEMERLTRQHRMACLVHGGLYPQALRSDVERLLEADGVPHAILDLGCGPGVWGVEMAQMHPHVEVIGFDLVAQSPSTAPPNFRFVQGDLTNGLPEYQDKFDVVHCRFVAGHLADPPALMTTIANCMKQDGILLISDGDLRLFDKEKGVFTPLRLDKESEIDPTSDNKLSYFAGWLEKWSDITVSPKYKTVDLLVQESGLFRDIVAHRFFTPLNWRGENMEHGEEIGRLTNDAFREFLRGCKPAFLRAGLTEDVVDRWAKESNREMDENQFYSIWHYTSAFKI